MKLSKEIIKDPDKLKAIDFVKIFLRVYKDTYEEGYSVNFARDCSLMKKVMNKLAKHGQDNTEMIKFLRWAWKNRKAYINKSHRKLRIGLLYNIVDDYIELKGFKAIDLSLSETKKEKLDEEMKAWLKKEREDYNE